MTNYKTLHNHTGLTKSLLQTILITVLKSGQPKQVVLYGSRARGDYKKTSDIDLAVETEPDNIYLIKDQLDETVPTLLKFDLVNLKTIDKKLKTQIKKEGLLLYEQNRAN